MRSALAILIAVVSAALLAACGDDEPSHTPVVSASNFSSPENGIAFRAPKGATVTKGEDEQVVVLRRGEATLTISRFPRPGAKLPRTLRDFDAAYKALGESYATLRGADPESISARKRKLAGHDGLFVSDGRGMHHHVYEFGNEFVVDMVAPPADLKRVRAVLFDPVIQTLEITKPQDE